MPLKRRAFVASIVQLVVTCRPLPVAAELIVGIAVPTEGSKAAAGNDIRRAATIAAEQLNESRDDLGEPIEIVTVNDGCAPKQAVEAAQDLIARGVKVVIGHPCASAAIAAAPVYAQAGIVFIAPLTGHPALTDERAGPTIFRLAGRSDGQAGAARDYLAQTFPGQPLAIISDGSRYARQIVNRLHANLKEAGFAEILIGSVKGAQKEFSALVAKLQEANTQALFYAGLPMEGALLLRQMRTAGLKTAFIGSDALATKQFVDAAGPTVSGVLILLPNDPAHAQGAAALPEELKIGDLKPSGAFVSTRAAMEVWADAVRRAGSSEPEAVSAALQHGAFDTVLGQISFNEIGDAEVADYALMAWRQGAWRPID